MERQIGETAKKQKEEKYLVLKLDDIKKYLNREEKKDLELMCQTIDLGRRIAGKHENHYVVVNEEEPYAEKVWDLILGRSQ